MEEFIKAAERGRATFTLRGAAKRYARALTRRDRSLKKLHNMGLCKLSFHLKLSRNLGHPYAALIETSNLCNLKCPLCPTGEGTLNRKPQNMSFEMFRKIVDEIAEYCVHLNITNYGEPLLNRDNYEMIYYAKQKGLRLTMGTNAHFMDDDKDLRCLIMSGLDEVYFSLDGADQQTYEMYRRNGDFARVVGNMRRLIEMKRKMQVRHPLVELQFLVMRQNEDQIDKMRELAKDLGVDKLSLKPVTFNNADWERDEIISLFKEFEPTQGMYRLYKHRGEGLRWPKEVTNYCSILWLGITILADGSMVPCCLDPRGEMVLGHVDDGIFNVWNNESYRHLRRQVSTDKKEVHLCSRCLGI